MATYSIGDFDRREVLAMLAALAASALVPPRFAAAQTGLRRSHRYLRRGAPLNFTRPG